MSARRPLARSSAITARIERMRASRAPAAVSMALVSAAVVGAALLGGCASAGQARTHALFPGRTSGAPSLSCLPELEEAPALGSSARLSRGLALAEASFRVPPPSPPESREASALSAWGEGPLRRWLEAKSDAVQAARAELDAAAEESVDQRILGGAVVGLMYEDLARVLAEVPAPSELDSEPEILELYRDLVESQARPFRELSSAAYRACSLNAAAGSEELRRFASFCRGRRDALVGDEPEALSSGATEVEVLRD